MVEFPPHLFDKLSSLYDTELSFKMKNDTMCRIVAKAYGIDVLSLLLYDGKRDMLVNRGNYYSADAFIFNNDKNGIKKHVMEHIHIYDFLYSRHYQAGMPSDIATRAKEMVLEISNWRNRYFNTNQTIDEITMKQCIKNAILFSDEKDGKYFLKQESFYYRFKVSIHSDVKFSYEIGDRVKYKSGRAYHRIVNQMHDNSFAKILMMPESELKLEQGEEDVRQNLKVLSDFEIDLKGDQNYYALPLIWNSSPKGILRIYMTQEKCTEFIREKLETSLQETSAIVAYLVDRSHYEDATAKLLSSAKHENWTGTHTNSKVVKDPKVTGLSKKVIQQATTARVSEDVQTASELKQGQKRSMNYKRNIKKK